MAKETRNMANETRNMANEPWNKIYDQSANAKDACKRGACGSNAYAYVHTLHVCIRAYALHAYAYALHVKEAHVGTHPHEHTHTHASASLGTQQGMLLKRQSD